MVKYKNKLNSKGFTLVELILVIGISSILFVLAMGIFFTGAMIHKKLHDDIEIHQQGSSIMDFMTSVIMTSNGIENIINYERISFYESNKRIELGAIKLKDLSLEDGQEHIVTIQDDPKMEGRSIRYGKINSAKIEVGNYINTIYTEPLPNGSFYNDARGIKLIIEMKKGRSNIEISKSMYFRKN